MTLETQNDPLALVTGDQVVSPTVAVDRQRRQPKVRKAFHFLLFLPSLLLIALFSYYPAVRSLQGSLVQWDGFSSPVFVGLQNFQDYIGSPIFRDEMLHQFLLVIGGVLISIIFPFLAAELVRSLPGRWFPSTVKYLLVLPMVIPQIVLINVWAYLLNPLNGPLDAFLGLFNIAPVQWFSNPRTALLSILLIGFPWVSSLGFLVFLAGLQAIPQELEDAGQIDGASAFARIVKIDLPLNIPQLRFVMVIASITMIQNFIPILLLTNGGPGHATMVPGLDMYTSAFEDSEFGFGMAIGTVLFIAMLVLTFLIFRLLRPRT